MLKGYVYMTFTFSGLSQINNSAENTMILAFSSPYELILLQYVEYIL